MQGYLVLTAEETKAETRCTLVVMGWGELLRARAALAAVFNSLFLG